MATMNVSLPRQMKEWVEAQAHDGQYANASDYVRDLIRRDQRRQNVLQEVNAALDEGFSSGISPRTPEELRAYARQTGDEAVKNHGVAHERAGG